MKRLIALMLVIALAGIMLIGCGKEEKSASESNGGTTKEKAAENTKAAAGGSVKEKDTLVFAWYPNESGAELAAARDEIGKVIEKATGKKVEHKTTTDYLIAIEAMVNDNADVAFFGAEGYVQAHRKNGKILPLVVNSGPDGTLASAVYYSWLNVRKGDEGQYLKDGKYSIDNIVGKKFSFVSNSSTSGFRVPSSGIKAYFSKKDKYKNLTVEDLIEGGKFFSEVLYGGSHQGSAVNLLTGAVDVAAFCDVCVANYVEFASGEENKPGAVYRVKADATEPFDKVRGAEFVPISVTPVLNAPFVVNTGTVSEKDIAAIKAALTSDETAKNEKIFVPKGSSFKGLFKQGERYLEVDDAWFQPIRALSEE